MVDLDFDPETRYGEGFLVCARQFAVEVTVRSERRRGPSCQDSRGLSRCSRSVAAASVG